MGGQIDDPAAGPGARTSLLYLAMVAGAIGLFLVIRGAGERLVAPAAAGGPSFAGGGRPADGEVLLHVLLALAVVVVAARALGAVFRLLHQPAVVGEVVAGILLGPSLLGRVAPGVSAYLLPAETAPYLDVISQVGVVLYMFLVGLDLDTGVLRRRAQVALTVSHASIVVPFLLGAALALPLYPRLASRGASFTVFALFLGVAMSVTAFPVLARILTDRGMQRTHLGALALTCAAINDVTAWCLLAFVVGVARAEPGQVLVTALLAAGYLAAMVAVRPAVGWFVRRQEARGEIGQGAMAVVFVALLVSAMATEGIGIHALFGAFLLGALVPRGSNLARQVGSRLEDLVVVLLLPTFFAATGLRTEIGLVSGLGDWLLCGAIVLVASAGKFGGTAVAARLTGLDWRRSAELGVLMNTRGLMELIVLSVGLDLGVVSPALFAMLVIMALVTTFATTPVLHLLGRRGAV